ncbi:MAG TPA: hypothetical protein VFA98_16195 [Thermoanaerobaculia bacterium]|nr:hypothetical protein [Thermoanaerobaculia bacterium]
MSRRVLALLACLVCIPASRLLAQAPAFAPEFQVNTYTTSSQYFPKVAADATGDFVVVWESGQFSNQDGSGSGIFAQRYDATGAKVGIEFQVNTYTTGLQRQPSVAMDPSGNFVVVWQSLNQDGSGQGVFGQLFDSTGAAQGSEFQVNTYTNGSQYAPSVAMSSGSGFVVAWQSYGQDGSNYGIVAKRFNSAGGALGSEFLINTYTTGVQGNPAVAMDPAGDFVIAWDGEVPPPAGGNSAYFGITAQRYDSAGNGQGQNIALDHASGSRPSVSLDATGNFVVVWTSLLSNIYAQRFDNAGTPQGVQFQANSPASSYQNTMPSVSMGSDESFVVVWKNNGTISGQRFDSGGFLVGSEFQVNADTATASSHPSVALTGNGNFVVGWASYAPGDSGYEVRARRAEGGAAASAAVDARTVTGSSSDHNGLLEAGETVQVAPFWTNVHPSAESLTGTASSLTGPAGPTYTIVDDTADYGFVNVGSLSDCFSATGDCYLMTVSGARPAPHWDATFTETLSDGFTKTWTLHVGASFTDVPTSLNFYPFIENIFHNGITGGCGGSGYCPATAVNRGQMAVFLLKAEHGSTYVPPACHSTFLDVPCPSLFADWIEELQNESVTGGCGGGNYCPDNPNTRGQMAVFLVKTFGLQLYGP